MSKRMLKTERTEIAKRANNWLANELKTLGESDFHNLHPDDADNLEIDFEEAFPMIDLGPNDDGFTWFAFDRNGKPSVAYDMAPSVR